MENFAKTGIAQIYHNISHIISHNLWVFKNKITRLNPKIGLSSYYFVSYFCPPTLEMGGENNGPQLCIPSHGEAHSFGHIEWGSNNMEGVEYFWKFFK